MKIISYVFFSLSIIATLLTSFYTFVLAWIFLSYSFSSSDRTAGIYVLLVGLVFLIHPYGLYYAIKKQQYVMCIALSFVSLFFSFKLLHFVTTAIESAGR